jgi:TRAP-type mannitol/chloroaromatic compound transport system substrate-binding protein
MTALFGTAGANPMMLPFTMFQTMMNAWLPMMGGQYWRNFYSDVSHPDHQEFATHAQLEVPEIIEEDGETNLFV